MVIVTDDVRWGDLGSYGGGAMRGPPVPNLDRIAADGMRFVNYYGPTSCTAGRASFITGRVSRTQVADVRAAGRAPLPPHDWNGFRPISSTTYWTVERSSKRL